MMAQQRPMVVEQELMDCCDWLFTELQIPYAISNHHVQTPLHKAAYAGNLPVLRYLVDRLGMRDDQQDQVGNTAANCAERGTPHNNNNHNHHSIHTIVARWLRRHACPILFQALRDLGLPECLPPPPCFDIRASFVRIAKSCHPNRLLLDSSSVEVVVGGDDDTNHNHHGGDGVRSSTTTTTTQWNVAQEAYRLLVDWHQLAPDDYDFQI
jgi:hypothetical protein